MCSCVCISLSLSLSLSLLKSFSSLYPSLSLSLSLSVGWLADIYLFHFAASPVPLLCSCLCLGGLDLCFGRYDDITYKLEDDVHFSTTWPGKDYYNPRVAGIAVCVFTPCV
jgi:hypothetical protein